MVGDSPEQRQKPDAERQQQNEARERLDVRTGMRIGLVKNDLSILVDMLSKEPEFESNQTMQSAYEQCTEMEKRMEQNKGKDVEKLLEETQQFIREQQERFLRKDAQQLRELQNSVTTLRKRFLEIPVAYDGDVPADAEIRDALWSCETLELMIRTRIDVKNPFASTESVQDFLRQFQAIKRVYNRRFLQNYLERVQGKLPAEASKQLRNIENSWAMDIAKQRKVRRWDGLGWKYETENDYNCDICTKGKNVTGYTTFLERLIKEFDGRPAIVDGIKRADRTRRQEAVLKDAKYAVRWQLAHLRSVYSHYEFLRPPSGEEEAGWASTEEGELYGLVYAAKRQYVEECKRYTELLASVDEDLENVQLRDPDLASEHAAEAISMMGMREAIDWVKRMGNLISENHMRSEGLKLTHMRLFAACRQALLKKAEELRREVVDDPYRHSQYQEYCLELAILFRTSPTIRRYRKPPHGPEYFETLQEDLSDSSFADHMAANVMDFENLAYQYGMKELLRGNPLRAVVADMRPNVLRKIESLDHRVQNNLQVQEMIAVINGDTATIEGLSTQYTVLRQMQEMLENGTSVEMTAIQKEIEEKFGPHFKRCTEEFEKFLNRGESGASYEEIGRVTGVELSEAQKSAYVLLADIRGHGWGNVSDETMQYVRIGTKITVMIAAGVAVGFATAGLGVVSASLIGGTAMTTTGLLINKQSFDSAEEAAVKVGPMWAADTLGFGTGRILSIGRTAAPLWRSGVIRNYADLRHFFATASRAGGQKAITQFDEAYGLGQRLLLTGVEGAADVTTSTAFDVMLVGGDFGERLTQNMMFLGLPVGMELRRGLWKHLRNATDQQLTLISRTMRDVQTENARLRFLCEGTKLQPQQVARIQNESDLMAALRSIEESKAESIRGSWQNIDSSRKVLRRQMGITEMVTETIKVNEHGVPKRTPEERIRYTLQNLNNHQNEKHEILQLMAEGNLKRLMDDISAMEPYDYIGADDLTVEIRNHIKHLQVPKLQRLMTVVNKLSEDTQKVFWRDLLSKRYDDIEDVPGWYKHAKGTFDPNDPPPPCVQQNRNAGNTCAVMTKDGTVYFKRYAAAHISVIQSNDLNIDDIIDGGWIIGGKYIPGGTELPLIRVDDRIFDIAELAANANGISANEMKAYKAASGAPSALKQYLLQNDVDRALRTKLAAYVLGKDTLSAEQSSAILVAHRKPGVIDKLTEGQKTVRGLALMRNNVFTRTEAQLLMDSGLAGNADIPHAIYEQLVNKRVRIEGKSGTYKVLKLQSGQYVLFSDAAEYVGIKPGDRLVPLEDTTVTRMPRTQESQVDAKQSLRRVLEHIKKQGEVYVYSRFLKNETPIGYEEFQCTGNQNAFSRYNENTTVNWKGMEMCAPLHWRLLSGRKPYTPEQVVGLRPHFDGKQWVVYCHISGEHSCSDGHNIIPLGIAVSMESKQSAEALLQQFEKNPLLIRPFFIEIGKEAQGSGVKAVLEDGSPRAPKYGKMKNAFLILREDNENFEYRYIDSFGKEMPISADLQRDMDRVIENAQWNQRNRLESEQAVAKKQMKKPWWKFW